MAESAASELLTQHLVQFQLLQVASSLLLWAAEVAGTGSISSR
jgi:hypothetical protein